MKSWQEDLLSVIEDALCEREILARIEAATLILGFEHVAYGFRAPLPLSNPKTVLLNNYPQAWRERYAQAGYLYTDPTVLHGRRSQSPLVWTDRVFENAMSLWEEAQSFGLKVGWAQSSLDGLGVGGMLTLSRSCESLSAKELEANQQKMRWLVHITHMALARLLKVKPPDQLTHCLTGRELEILKWTGDGKSSQDIADILTLSKNTVDFHVKNAVVKLQATNKTAAVVRAAMLGYLN
jgi:DNA-binding CsgD family transcriptional regulator